MKTQLLNYPRQKDLIQDRLSTLLGLNFKSISRDRNGQNLLNLKGYFSQEERFRIVVKGQTEDISIKELCAQEGITTDLFYRWTQEFLNSEELVDKSIPGYQTDDDRFRIVLEALNGEFSVAEICRRENLTHETFLQWSRSFLKERRASLRYSSTYVRKPSEVRAFQAALGEKVFDFLESYIDFQTDQICLSTSPDNSLTLWREAEYAKLVCTYRMNDIRHINKHFEALNNEMQIGDVLVGCMETFSARKRRIWINKIPLVNNLYFGLEFVVKRIIPKMHTTKRYYFQVTKGKNRLLSKAEALGRLVSCGFKIMDHMSINGLVYFVVQKEKQPVYDMNPSYGPIYAMPRLGKNGKIIKVFKLRTMHPYSEYLQDYIVRANGYAESGKPADDFRIPEWGKFMRRLWLDELPQLINFIKGDLKLVGIRPVSERYFQDIPKEMQRLRLTQKPGCIPPYVSLNRSGNVMAFSRRRRNIWRKKFAILTQPI